MNTEKTSNENHPSCLGAIIPSLQHPKYFAEWILANCTFWGNEWFMYKGYRYTADELYEVWNNPKNEIISNEL